jgi:hypothetical protein
MAVKSGFGVVLTHGELMDILSLINKKEQTNEILMKIENPPPSPVIEEFVVEPSPIVSENEKKPHRRRRKISRELDLKKELDLFGDVAGVDFYNFVEQYLSIKRDYTYGAIAKALGCTDTTICNWINKKQKMSAKLWKRVSAVDKRLPTMRAETKRKKRTERQDKKEVTRRIKMDDASTSDVRYTLFNKAIKYRGTAESRLSEALSEMSDCSHSTMAKVFNMSIERYKKFRVDESIKMPRAIINMFKLYVHESTNE